MSKRKNRTNFIRQGGVRAVLAWPVLLLHGLKIIYLADRNGMTGIGYFAMAEALFFVLFTLLVTAVTPVVKRMVYFQVNKASHKNAAKVYRKCMAFIVPVAAVIVLLLFGFSQPLSVALFGTKLCALLMKLFAAALLFYVLAACIRGYLEGMGNPMPGMTAEIVSAIFGLLATVLSQAFFSDYGNAVAALVGQEEYYYAYGVCSGAVGCLVGGVAECLFLIIILSVFRGVLREREHADDTRQLERTRDIMRNFAQILFPNALDILFAPLLCLLLIIAYCKLPSHTPEGAGILYCALFILSTPVLLTAHQVGQPFMRQLTVILKRQDYHHARERICINSKVLLYMVLPYLTVMLCLAGAVAAVLFDTENASLVRVIRLSVPVILLAACAEFFGHIAQVVVRTHVRNINSGVSLVAAICCFGIVRNLSGDGLTCALLAALAGWGVALLLEIVSLFRRIRFLSQRFLQCLGFFAASAGMAVLLLLSAMLMYGKIPNLLFVVLAIVIGTVGYQCIIAVLSLFEPFEWKLLPGNQIPAFFAGLLGRRA